MGKLTDNTTTFFPESMSGWWNSVCVADLDGDGNEDLIMGNQGLNNPYAVSATQPVRLYTKDFDGNGTIDPVMSCFIQATSYPIYARDDLMDHLPFLKKKFATYLDYAKASFDEIFPVAMVRSARKDSAIRMETSYWHNTGKGRFEQWALPSDVQLAPVFSIIPTDVNGDGKPDLVIGGNNKWSRIKLGATEANHGQVLLNDGSGHFSLVSQPETGLGFRGDVRSMVFARGKGVDHLLVGFNNDGVRQYNLKNERSRR